MTVIAPTSSPFLHLSHPDHHIPGYELPENASKPPTKKICLIGFLIAALVAVAAWFLHVIGEGAPIPQVSLAWVLPFTALLACIAIMPFAAKHFWEKNYQNVSIALALLVVGYYLFGLSAHKIIAHTFADYISFIFLLGSLFVISGGVIIRVHRKATPFANVVLLLTGAILANIFGTTGASMLLIRPFLHLNKGRVRPYHVVFFIFCIANVGGALTPVGDPPLFLGYLKGVPFWWVLQHCWPIWFTAVGALLAIFFVIDTLQFRKTPPASDAAHEGLSGFVSVFGVSNLFWIVLVLVAVFLPAPFREFLMAAAAFGSLATTSHRIYGENHFNYAPIKEVALLFVGIFATMVPAMNYLHNHANDDAFRKYLDTPGQFYYSSGALSSVLDNAPTYVTFLETAIGKHAAQSPKLADLLNDPSFVRYLIAISMGAVFFGACTYIGNGPNFMVKSIADHAGVQTPSFFGYIFWYTLPIFFPVLVLCWALYI